MRFNFLISKQANFYFFISNLSEWHFSCGKYHNVFWKKELGEFSKKEKEALIKFKKVRLKYPEGESLFEISFFTKENPFLELRKKMPTDDYKIIVETFSALETKFNLIYKKDLPFLKKWNDKLNINANNKIETSSIVKILETLFKTSPIVKRCDVYLLLSSFGYTGGSANINKKSINIEISRHSLKNAGHAVSIVWHEIIHLLFQKAFFDLVLKILKNRQKARIVNEIIISSLFPRGVLGEKFFKNKLTDKINSKVNQEQTKKILKLTESFVLRKKSFDERYIKEIVDILKL